MYLIVGPFTISVQVTHSACLFCLLLRLNITMCVVINVPAIKYTTIFRFTQLELFVEFSFAYLRSEVVPMLVKRSQADLHEKMAEPFAEANA